MINSIDVIAHSMLKISESLTSIHSGVCVLRECREYMRHMALEMKKMNELLEKIHCEEENKK